MVVGYIGTVRDCVMRGIGVSLSILPHTDLQTDPDSETEKKRGN